MLSSSCSCVIVSCDPHLISNNSRVTSLWCQSLTSRPSAEALALSTLPRSSVATGVCHTSSNRGCSVAPATKARTLCLSYDSHKVLTSHTPSFPLNPQPYTFEKLMVDNIVSRQDHVGEPLTFGDSSKLGVPFWESHSNKDYSILGSILGSLYYYHFYRPKYGKWVATHRRAF